MKNMNIRIDNWEQKIDKIVEYCQKEDWSARTFTKEFLNRQPCCVLTLILELIEENKKVVKINRKSIDAPMSQDDYNRIFGEERDETPYQ